MRGIYDNAGDHIEESGSAPLKKVRAGEVAIGFGLRHQAVADKESGLPIDYVDPSEGTFTLTESVAVVDKDVYKRQQLYLVGSSKDDLVKNEKDSLKFEFVDNEFLTYIQFVVLFQVVAARMAIDLNLPTTSQAEAFVNVTSVLETAFKE